MFRISRATDRKPVNGYQGLRRGWGNGTLLLMVVRFELGVMKRSEKLDSADVLQPCG